MRAWKMFFFYQLSHGWKHHIGSSIVRHTVLKILEREPLKRTRFAFSSFTPLNWDFVLYLGGKRTEHFLSELFLPHEKTTCIKAGKTKYAAFGKAGNPRVTGIQTENAQSCWHWQCMSIICTTTTTRQRVRSSETWRKITRTFLSHRCQNGVFKTYIYVHI